MNVSRSLDLHMNIIWKFGFGTVGELSNILKNWNVEIVTFIIKWVLFYADSLLWLIYFESYKLWSQVIWNRIIQTTKTCVHPIEMEQNYEKEMQDLQYFSRIGKKVQKCDKNCDQTKPMKQEFLAWLDF